MVIAKSDNLDASIDLHGPILSQWLTLLAFP